MKTRIEEIYSSYEGKVEEILLMNLLTYMNGKNY